MLKWQPNIRLLVLFTAATLLLLAPLWTLPLNAQQPQQAPDVAVVAMKLEGAQFLLDAREKQIVQMARQAEAEHAYWAAYVAGLSAPLSEKAK